MIKTKFQDDKYLNIFTNKEEQDFADSLYNNCKYIPKNYTVLQRFFTTVSGCRAIVYVIGTLTASRSLRRGYKTAYVVNLDIPHFSELGEVYVDKDDDGTFYVPRRR